MSAELLVSSTVGEYVLSVCRQTTSLQGVESIGEVCEIMGGNLNYAWRVQLIGSQAVGSVFVKQAPGFIKCLGSDYELYAARMHREVNALRALHQISQRHAPRVLCYDDSRCIAIMEDLVGFVLLNEELLAGRIDARLAADLGAFLRLVAQATVEPMENTIMCAITLDYVFTKPFVDDPTNRTDLGVSLQSRATALRRDATFLEALKQARSLFETRQECLCHGDLHAGSIMTNGEQVRVIDAEFAFKGPAAFDLALLMSGYMFAYCSADAFDLPNGAMRRSRAKRAIRALFDAYGTLQHLPDAARLASCELMRRVLGAASVPFLSNIEARSVRAHIELLVLETGATLLQNPPMTLDTLCATLDDCYDAHAFATGGLPEVA